MSPHFAFPPGSSEIGFSEIRGAPTGTDLQYVLTLTHRLSEEVLCAKLSGRKPLEQHITKLVIIAIELKKIGVQYPTSLKYALDIPSQASAAELGESERLGKLKGYVEAVTSEHVQGWALNEGLAGKAAELEIVVNRVPVAVVSANIFRGDLAEAGLGSGYHAFMHRFDASISLIQNKKVVVRRRSDRALLQAILD
ncbi:hypothetical protein [Methylobacterium sp. A52T]